MLTVGFTIDVYSTLSSHNIAIFTKLLQRALRFESTSKCQHRHRWRCGGDCPTHDIQCRGENGRFTTCHHGSHGV